MLQERAQTGSLCYKKEHKLEVYATRKSTNWKFMLQERAQTGSLCYKKEHKLEVYATRKSTNWKFMLQERAQTGSLCYKKEAFSIRNGITNGKKLCETQEHPQETNASDGNGAVHATPITANVPVQPSAIC